MSRRLQMLLGWVVYACSAAPFVFFVAAAFSGDLTEDSTYVIIVNAMMFAAVGVTAILVKHAAFNLCMALNAIPYETLLVSRMSTDSSRWSAMDIKGSVAYASLYCLIGWASTAVWLLIHAGPIWRRAGAKVGCAPPPPGP